MIVYLIRHADALPLGTAGIVADEERPLSDRGRREIEALAGSFERKGVKLRKVASSPLRRARETAELLAAALGVQGGNLIVADALAPGASSKEVAEFLRGLEGDHIALVGHEPDMGQHTAWLIGSKKAQIEFAKGAAACIACEQPIKKGAGRLQWLITPTWCE